MNALRYAWDREGAEPLRFSFASCERDPRSWREEMFAAAQSVAARTKKRIWVASSGGIDSEIVCRAFFEQGLPFSVVTLRHSGGTNEHDIQFAARWCSEHGVEQRIVEVDMERFLTDDLEDYMRRYVAIHPYRYFQIRVMELVEEMGGFAVIASGEQIYGVDRTKEAIARADMFIRFSNGNVAPLQWCEDHATEHEPYFGYATPEVCLAYLRSPLVAAALDNPEAVFRHRGNAYTLKRIVCQGAWPDIQLRHKADGYERIRPLLNAAIERMREALGEKQIEYKLPVVEFERQLTAALRG